MHYQIRHLNSATQIISCGGVSILTDPWLTQGEYYGSWYFYPPFDKSEIRNLKFNYIYCSHIHPDHLSKSTFKLLKNKVPVIISKFSSSFLKKQIEMLGHPVIELKENESFHFSNEFKISCFRAGACIPSNCYRNFGCSRSLETEIDSMALFEARGKKILNLNDCPFEIAEKTIKDFGIHKQKIHLLLLPYAGAGPYPQCYNYTSKTKHILSKQKQLKFLNSAVNYINLIGPVYYAPFAGEYILGGRLFSLNKYRGMPSKSIALDYIQQNIKNESKGVLLFNGSTYKCLPGTEETISSPKHSISLNQFCRLIRANSLVFDKPIKFNFKIFWAMITVAYENFINKANRYSLSSKTNIIVVTEDISFMFSLSNSPIVLQNLAKVHHERPYLIIKVKTRMLIELLKGPKYCHWNNAEISSQLHYERNPDIYEKDLFTSLSFFHSR